MLKGDSDNEDREKNFSPLKRFLKYSLQSIKQKFGIR